jgi:DNA-binding NtrC family response regulator
MANSPHILLIDDDQRVVRFLKKALEENGYTVIATTSSHCALAVIQQRLPDLLILNLNMPEPDGLDSLKAERSRFPCLTNLVISGYLDRALLKAAQILGAIATLEKALTPDELAATFRGVLGR